MRRERRSEEGLNGRREGRGEGRSERRRDGRRKGGVKGRSEGRSLLIVSRRRTEPAEAHEREEGCEAVEDEVEVEAGDVREGTADGKGGYLRICMSIGTLINVYL